MAFTALGVQGAKAEAEKLKAKLARRDEEVEKLSQTVERSKTKEKKLTDEHRMNVAASAGVAVGSSYLWNLANGAYGNDKGVWNIFGEVPGDAFLGAVIGGLAFGLGKGWVRDLGVGFGAGGLASFASRQGMETGINIRHKRLGVDAPAVAQLQGTTPRQIAAPQGATYDGHTVSYAQDHK